ncbi:hypothetical protein OUZ56_021377 [Daphnia magna]|uniref:Secreted protein n=1 Tax=Daphnia magna TaxID=35525 RepID=A0ABQ9ZH70_9CRUS|nr:hypothetical protein OUZ56_021377 [Daphnia magna]
MPFPIKLGVSFCVLHSFQYACLSWLSSKINDKRGEEKERQGDIETRDVELRLKEHVRELHRNPQAHRHQSAQVQRANRPRNQSVFVSVSLCKFRKQEANRKEGHESSGYYKVL